MSTRWVDRLDEVMSRPRMARLAVLMGTLAVTQGVASAISIATVKASDQVDMSVFNPVVLTGAISVPLVALACFLIARSDAEGESLVAHAVLLIASTGFGAFGVGVAYIFGFWTSPFTLMCVVAALIMGSVVGRPYGWISLGVGVAGTIVLELLRHADVIPNAPALLDRTVDGSGDLLRTIGTGVPLALFTAYAVVLSFCALRTNERQRQALAHTHEVIRRYVPAQVADVVLDGREASTELERRKLTIFFSDVVTFTETTDRMEPEELARVLDDYFSEMTRIAERYDGTIDELIGDAVLIFFGAPAATDDRDHAVRAVRMAIDMQRAVDELNRGWEEAGIDAAFRIRMGINTGVVTVGNVGTGARRKYAALGRAVNLAARIQTHCDPGDILISRPTWLLVRHEVACAPRGEVELKGVTHPTELYSVDLGQSSSSPVSE